MPGFLGTLGITLVAGREFTRRRGADARRRTSVIVSETLARRFWPDQDPIGKRIKIGTAGFDRPVADHRRRRARGEMARAAAESDSGSRRLLQPFQPQTRDFALLVRTRVPPETVIDSVRRAIRAVEPGATLFNVATMEERVAGRMARPRFVSWLMGVFAGLALLLSAIGVYGVLAQNVARRTQEIGIRMALGAGAGEILRLVLRRGLGLVGVGLAIGAAGALAMTRLLQTLLFGVSQTDPVTFAGVMRHAGGGGAAGDLDSGPAGDAGRPAGGAAAGLTPPLAAADPGKRVKVLQSFDL